MLLANSFLRHSAALAIWATAAVLEYVEETLPAAIGLLDRLDLYAVEGSMVLDGATRRSLELTESLRVPGQLREVTFDRLAEPAD